MKTRREIWIENRGSIPKGWVSVNLNGQSSDNRVENITVIPRSSNLRSIIAPFIERIRRLERELNAPKTKEVKTK